MTTQSDLARLSNDPYSTMLRPDTSRTIEALKDIQVHVKRQDITHGFVLNNILSDSECKHYLQQVEKFGYGSLDLEYPSEYRNSDRCLVFSKDLSDILWSRIAPNISKKDLVGLKPMDFDNDGVWYPIRVNDCFKFNRYRKGSYFRPHVDGLHNFGNHELNIYTVVIYLNDDFEGGGTNFLDPGDVTRVNNMIRFFESKKDKTTSSNVEKVVPKMGSALIFPNYHLHEGEVVTHGTKYIIRTEIIFRKVPTSEIVEDSESQVSKQKCLDLFDKTIQQMTEKKDSEVFTKTYLEAISLQYEHLMRKKQEELEKLIAKKKPIESGFEFTSVFDSSSIYSQDSLLPAEIVVNIQQFLEAKSTLRSGMVSKFWRACSRDSDVWSGKFKIKWPESYKVMIKENPHNISLIPWFFLYSSHSLNEKMKSPVMILLQDQINIFLMEFGRSYLTSKPATISLTFSCWSGSNTWGFGNYTYHPYENIYTSKYWGDDFDDWAEMLVTWCVSRFLIQHKDVPNYEKPRGKILVFGPQCKTPAMTSPHFLPAERYLRLQYTDRVLSTTRYTFISSLICASLGRSSGWVLYLKPEWQGIVQVEDLMESGKYQFSDVSEKAILQDVAKFVKMSDKSQILIISSCDWKDPDLGKRLRDALPSETFNQVLTDKEDIAVGAQKYFTVLNRLYENKKNSNKIIFK